MIYVTGDTHSKLIERISKKYCKKYNQSILQRGDILIVLGDLGVVWSDTTSEQINYINKYLKERGILVLSVLGNHCCYDKIEKLSQQKLYGGLTYKVSSNLYFLQNSELFDIQDNKLAVFGGALSIDKMYRKEGVSWWSQEIPSKETMQKFIDNLEKVDTEDYYLLTHTTDSDMIRFLLWQDNPKIDDVSNFLQHVKARFKFKKHYFGHMHDNRNLKDNSILLYENIIKLGDDIKDE